MVYTLNVYTLSVFIFIYLIYTIMCFIPIDFLAHWARRENVAEPQLTSPNDSS